MTAEIGVLLVDDQELVRSGLRRILRRKDGFSIVAECADGDEVIAALDGHAVDVVIMDLRMKRVSGVDATEAICARPDHPSVLVLTTFDDDEMLSGAIRAGASGFALKDSPAEDLIRAVRTVAAGESWLDPGVTARVMTAYRQTPRGGLSDPAELLSPRELEVLVCVGRGMTNTEIASELFISELTVKSHIGRLFSKLDLRDRAAAVVYAYETGVVGSS